MSRFITGYIPEPTNNAIALEQNVPMNSNFILNDAFAENGTVSLIKQGYATFVTATTAADNATLTVTGSQNGVAIIDTIILDGTATTYPTSLVFDTITTVSTDVDVEDISLGVSYTGFFPLIQVDTEGSKTTISCALSLALSDSIPGFFVIYQSLTDLGKLYGIKTFPEMIGQGLLIEGQKVEASSIIQLTGVCSYLLIGYQGANDNTSTFQMQFLQL